MSNIVVIGMGYVGIPCAVLLADVPGFHVTGIQRRSARSGWKIECLNNGECPFDGDEPGLDELIHRVAVEKQTFRVTDDYAACEAADVILIDVQTPTDAVQGNRIPHYESLREVSSLAGQRMRPGTLVIIESTVAPGTTQHVVQPILERESRLRAGAGEQGFYLAFSYERVMPGKLLAYITDFPRVVGGVDAESTRRAVDLYRHIVLTDSGGIQEEAPGLGKPVLVLREKTERPEAVEAGTVQLVGTDRECIVRETMLLLDDSEKYVNMAQAVNPYGDGHAAERIVGALLGEDVASFEPGS